MDAGAVAVLPEPVVPVVAELFGAVYGVPGDPTQSSRPRDMLRLLHARSSCGFHTSTCARVRLCAASIDLHVSLAWIVYVGQLWLRHREPLVGNPEQ